MAKSKVAITRLKNKHRRILYRRDGLLWNAYLGCLLIPIYIAASTSIF